MYNIISGIKEIINKKRVGLLIPKANLDTTSSIMKTKVLAVFNHRPEKVRDILPYADCDYRFMQFKKTELVKTKIKIGIIRALKKRVPIIFSMANYALDILNIKIYMTILRQMIAFKPDILISNGGSLGYRVRLIAALFGKKFILRIGGHIYAEQKENKGLSSRLFMPAMANVKRADHIIVVTNDMKRQLALNSGRQVNNISVVPVSLDIGKYSNGTRGYNGRHILTVTKSEFKTKVDGLLDFLPAVLAILDKYQDAYYTIIAPGRYYDYITWHTRYCQRVRTYEYIEDIKAMYDSADVMAYFSYLDGCPNVILESWCNRLPVVANNCNWSNELIKTGETGILTTDIKNTSEAIENILNCQFLSKRLAANGYNYVCKNHSHYAAGKALKNSLTVARV